MPLNVPIIVIDRRRTDIRRVPAGTSHSRFGVGNAVWLHNQCHSPVELYADYSAWCPTCKCNVRVEDRTEQRLNRRRRR